MVVPLCIGPLQTATRYRVPCESAFVDRAKVKNFVMMTPDYPVQDQVAALLNAGADVNTACRYVGQTPIYLATRNAPPLVSCRLSALGAALFFEPPTRLRAAFRLTRVDLPGWGREEVVEHLLRSGANPNKPDKFGKNAFDAADASGDLSARMRELLERLVALR